MGPAAAGLGFTAVGLRAAGARALTRRREPPAFRSAAAEGAAEDPAALHFVLVGNFVEAPFNYGDCGSLSQVAQSERARYTSGLDRLADLIAEFPAIAASSHFILVPGPNDPTFGGFILPQPPLPQTFTAALRKKVAHVTLATNPCRIRFFSQELIVFRDDLYRKARRHCLPALPPIGSEEPHNHLVKTLVDQAHLSPVPVTVTPVYWAQDHALRLFPLPDMVVVCGGGESWETEYMGCPFLNPGSFSRNRTFLIHQPAQRHSQFQQMK
jgi:DNA polymerase epsilon subunit 2